MLKKVISATVDSRTAAALRLIAQADYDGNISMALRMLIRKAATEREWWPLSDEQVQMLDQSSRRRT